MSFFKSHHRRPIYDSGPPQDSRLFFENPRDLPSRRSSGCFDRLPVCHDFIPGHQVSYQRFWENRWIPDSLPASPRPRRKPPHIEPTLIKVKRHLPSMSFYESHRRQPSITRFARLNKQRSGDFRLFPPANFANSAILPTDKISAFFMQNFLPQKPKDSSLLCPRPHRGE